MPQLYRAIQIAPGGRRIYLLDSAPGRLHAWEIEGTPEDSEVRSVEARPGFPPFEGLTSLALRPDGAILALGDRSGNVTLFDTVRRAVVGSIHPSVDESESFFLTLAFSGDGRTLAVGSQQGIISLYAVDDPARAQLQLRLPGHHGLVLNLAFDATNGRLASATTDPVAEVWDLDLIRRELAQRGLSPSAR
jgi:WD40 repeat protein